MDVRPPGSNPYPDPRQGGYQPPAAPQPPGYGYPRPASPPPGHGYPPPPASPPSGYAPAPATPVTYRPTRQVRTRLFAGGIGVLALTLFLIGMKAFSDSEGGGPTARVVMLVLAGVIVAAVLGSYLVYLRTLSVTVDSGGVTRRAFGRSRRIPRDLLQGVVQVSYLQRSRYLTREVPLVAFVDATGRAQLTLNLQIWSGADAQAIVTQLGLLGSVTSLGLRSVRHLKKEVPGALPWVVAHRVAAASILVGITFVVVAAVAVGVVLAGS